jgi:hypothetical protein
MNASGSTLAANQDAIINVFRSIEGPFAFVYYDGSSGTLYFGRDRLGRRSLMISLDKASGTLTLCSIAESCDPQWKEVEADGIYQVNLQIPRSDHGHSASQDLVRHEWLMSGQADSVSPPRGSWFLLDQGRLSLNSLS